MRWLLGIIPLWLQQLQHALLLDSTGPRSTWFLDRRGATGLMHTFRAILALALASSVCADTHSGTKRILAVPRGILEQCTEQSIEISRQSDFMANQTARHLLWHATGLNSGNCVWRQGALDMVQTEQTVVVDDETAVGEPRLAALVLQRGIVRTARMWFRTRLENPRRVHAFAFLGESASTWEPSTFF